MDKVKNILDKVAFTLSSVSGIESVVLGGSRARGTNSEDSDIDIGLYYDDKTLDLSTLNIAAKKVDNEHRECLIAPPGEWGKWVNGGGWLVVDGYHVDFLLRDIARVEKAITECQQGIVTAHYQTGHPHAYLSVMYAGELAVCKMLFDKDGKVSALKNIAEKYPLKLKESIIDFFSFEMGFSLIFAENNLDKDDNYYVMAHMVRSISAINQVLFALNEEYCLNEKKAVKMVDDFSIRPTDYKLKVDRIFDTFGTDKENACALLGNLIKEVRALL